MFEHNFEEIYNIVNFYTQYSMCDVIHQIEYINIRK